LKERDTLILKPKPINNMIKFFSWASLLSAITIFCVLGHAIVSYVLDNPIVYMASLAIFVGIIVFEFIRNMVQKNLANQEPPFKANSISDDSITEEDYALH
jgi:hypothetical protein